MSHSKDFFWLIKSIGESRTKQDEDRIIRIELEKLKQCFQQKTTTPQKICEYLIRMIYVEMLGHDASFGHIHAVKSVSLKGLREKRIGYLTVGLTLNREHEFLILLLNTMQQDLRSDNFLEVNMALIAVSQLINKTTIPAVVQLVEKLLNHSEAAVRKKAIVAIQKFWQLDPSAVTNLDAAMRKVLCDRDPSVMGASLPFFVELIANNANKYKDLVPSFVSILKQIIDRKLPREYDYHGVPAPWIQIDLLRALATLGHADQRSSEGMYEVVGQAMKAADVGFNAGYAVLSECINTITKIYPNKQLLDQASNAVSRFIVSDNYNLKYMGVTSLASIVEVDPSFAGNHQLTVIDCLENPDETLRRKTLDLLYVMTNPHNVEVIVDKLVSFLGQATDDYLRKELCARITQLSEKFAPSSHWYIQTMNTVFEVGGEFILPAAAQSVMRLIAESDNVDPQEEDIRVYAVESYLEMLRNGLVMGDRLAQVAAWVIGEYGQLAKTANVNEVVALLNEGLLRPHDSPETASWFLVALMKQCVTAQLPLSHVEQQFPALMDVLYRYQNSTDTDLQQTAYEFTELLQSNTTLTQAVLPVGQANIDPDVDEDLSFLDQYVQKALDNGAKAYQSSAQLEAFRSTATETKNESGQRRSVKDLNFTPYDDFKAQKQKQLEEQQLQLQQQSSSNDVDAKESTGLNLSGVTSTWGPSGFNSNTSRGSTSSSSQPQESTQSSMFANMSAVSGPADGNPSSESSAWEQEASERKAAREAERNRASNEPPSEREQMANALFMGLGGSSTTTNNNNNKLKPNKSRAPKQTYTSKPVVSSSGGSMFSGMQPQQPQQQQQPQQSGELDFNSMFAFNDSPQQPQQQTQDVVTAMPDFTSMFVDTSTPQVTPVTSGQSTGNNNNNMFGNVGFSTAFDTSNVPTPSTARQQLQQQQQTPVGLAAVRGDIEQKLIQSAVNQNIDNIQENVLVRSDWVHVSSLNVSTKDTMMAVLCVSNMTQGLAAQADLQVQLTVPLQLRVTHVEGVSGNVEFKISSSTSVNISVNKLLGGYTRALIVHLKCVDASVYKVSGLKAAVLASSTGQQAKFVLPVGIGDLLSPFPLTTPQFGASWKKFGASKESKFQIANAHTTTNDALIALVQRLGIHHVQSIKAENICAANLVGLGEKGIILVHVKLPKQNNQAVSVLVRSDAKPLSESMYSLLTQAFTT